MKRINIILIIILMTVSFSCNQDKSPEQISQEITEKKKEIRELRKQVSELESKLEEDTVSRVPVHTKTVDIEVFKHMIEVNGSVEAELQANVSPEINGHIKMIHVNEGQRVSEGQQLLTLSTEVVSNNIQEVKTSLDLARTTYEKQKKLWDQEIGSEMEYLQAKNRVESLESRLKTLQAQLDMAQIKAPFAGIVDDIMMKRGDLAMPGSPLLTMVNLKDLKVNTHVSEAYLSKVEKGDTVRVEFPAFSNLSMDVPVFRTGNIINPDNRTFKVQIKINNIESKLKPNIIAIVHINDYTNRHALVVPSIVIKKDMDGSFLFVVKQDEKEGLVAEKRYVETGKSYRDQTEVLSGLNEGDRVIVEGYNMVTSGTKVSVKKKF